jgi:hypothetical protein
MKTVAFFSLSLIVLIGCTGISIAQQSKIRAEVWRTLQEKGRVRVLVLLNMPWKSEGELNKDEVLVQRQAIASIQNRILSELAGTTHRLIRQYTMTPSIALEIGPDALAVLEQSVTVVGVSEESFGGPAIK